MDERAKAEEVVQRRRQRSQPLLDQIKASLQEDTSQHLPKAAMAEAIGYR